MKATTSRRGFFRTVMGALVGAPVAARQLDKQFDWSKVGDLYIKPAVEAAAKSVERDLIFHHRWVAKSVEHRVFSFRKYNQLVATNPPVKTLHSIPFTHPAESRSSINPASESARSDRGIA